MAYTEPQGFSNSYAPVYAVLPVVGLHFLGRVMRAWWSSRSSKPLPRHFVPGGRFDSYPLRHLLTFEIIIERR
jgi:hypothetical protein